MAASNHKEAGKCGRIYKYLVSSTYLCLTLYLQPPLKQSWAGSNTKMNPIKLKLNSAIFFYFSGGQGRQSNQCIACIAFIG